MAEPLLALKTVDAFYGAVQAHFGVSLHVSAAEIVCLLGGNASGKSTAMKVILGLLEPRSGDVEWEGSSWRGVPTSRRVGAGLASVPESRRLFADMTVGENLLMGGYTRPHAARERDEVLELFPLLRERLHQRAGTLSGGEQQLTALARALMSRPRLICMDEPTMGLSPLWVDRVWELVTSVNRGGTAFFLVEQNARLALELAHRGYVLQNGHIVLEGPAEALRNDPRVQDAYLGSEQL